METEKNREEWRKTEEGRACRREGRRRGEWWGPRRKTLALVCPRSLETFFFGFSETHRDARQRARTHGREARAHSLFHQQAESKLSGVGC